jgi:Zn-dependent alcohol dehydrogenase
VLTGAGVILNTLGVRVNESVAVFGAGGVGLCAGQSHLKLLWRAPLAGSVRRDRITAFSVAG